MQVLAEYAASQGVEVFYDTEAKQLVGDASGVTGVIAETADGNVRSTPPRASSWLRQTTRTTTI